MTRAGMGGAAGVGRGRSGRGWLALAVLVLGLLWGASSGAASAGAAVAWNINSVSATNAVPGTTLTYFIHVADVGGDPSSSAMVFDGVLPVGVSVVSVESLTGHWDCSSVTAGVSSFSCAGTGPYQPAVGLSQFPDLRVTANVGGGVSGLHSALFTVSGGDASNPSASVSDPTVFSAAPFGFGIDGFDGQDSDSAGGAFTQAGGHPYSISTEIAFNQSDDPVFGAAWPKEPTKDVVVDLPPGLVGNPTATGDQRCTTDELAVSQGVEATPTCPPGSQIGTAVVDASGSLSFGGLDVELGPVSVFNMVPPPGVPARFGFNIAGSIVTLNGHVRSDGDYGLSVNTADIPEALATSATRLTFWGVPSDASHDPLRSCPGLLQPYRGGPSCSTDAPAVPFLRNPTSCSAPAGSPVSDGLITALHIDSWDHPGRLLADGSPDLSDPRWVSSSFVSHVPPGYPASPDDPSTPWGAHALPSGCEKVPFSPSIDARPAGVPGPSSPSAFAFDVSVPQNQVPNGIGEGDLRKAVVSLPAGVRVSPSSAQGLAGCSPDQVGLHSTGDASCPDGAKLGTVTVTTPLLNEPLSGSIYLASPHQNPFGTLIALYLVVRGDGVVVKLPGRVDPDPSSGQLTATFDENPQLPFSDLHLAFNGGPRAPIVTPDVCGTYTTNATFTSWSGAVVPASSDFTVGGGDCGPRGFAPVFQAGTVSPAAGGESPFVLSLTRSDRDQNLSGLTVAMPQGLLGRIKNTTLCSDADAQHGTCGEASRLGSVTVGAGAGSNPFYITNGRVYITGPYKGGPFGLSIVVPAVAGPFDLGNVIVRASIQVNPTTAALKVVSDPLPTILDGIPLDVRDVRVKIDRPHFIINPTHCTQSSVGGTFVSTSGTVAHGSTRFRAAACGDLRLAPTITLSVGARHRTAAGSSVPFSTTITQTPGESNLRKVSVTLPTVLNARLNVVERACTLAQFHAGHCEQARAGSAVAVTPLLKSPLRGGVYFVKNGRPLPDLMVALRGQVSIDLDGIVTIPGSKHLATTFATIPDAPITSFKLSLVAGSHGPVGVIDNLCSAKARNATAAIGIRGQNGDLIKTNQHLHINGCPTKGHATKHKKK